MKKGILLSGLFATFFVSQTAFASLNSDLSSIYRGLDENVEDARDALIKTETDEKRGHLGREDHSPSIQQNVVRPTYADLTEKKDSQHFKTQVEGNKRLEYAIKMRQKREFKQKYVRTLDYKNRLGQINRHKVSRYYSDTPESSTSLKRTGELEDVPYYEYRRHYNNPSSIRKNSKQIFKRRAVDYYINGGDAGSEALRSDVIIGSEHRVPRYFVPVSKTADAKADVVDEIRDVQRNIGESEQVPTGYQKQTQYRPGGYRKSFTNPWQYPSFVE